ncbi:MAG: flagellar M-ring protein FliF, partial [Gammaproteobacteria bacterium]|nr:flagellar M-ring protein FliF [Gammaproteobacteria bacterium]
MAEALAINPQASLLLLLRQAGVMVALAASVALGLYVALWARTPEYTVLYTDLSERDLSQVVDALQSNAIPYRMDANGGAILVAADKVHDARLKLAAAGLPRSAGMGFEMLEQEQGFGTSQFLEQARYQRAIEGELSRSIAHINNVRAARVHLAVPKQSAFSRTRREPTASVIVDLYNGRRLEPHQVGAIVHMVSASVPSMSPDQVTVIDQQGNLLTDTAGGSDELVLSAKRFEYTRRLEESFVDRIEAILMPLVGPDGVRAQVTADIDFTTTEQTRESFNPDLPAVRSENLIEEERRGGGGPGGVPGALSNEPPAAATAPEQVGAADGTGQQATTASAAANGNRRSQTTRNYELDRTISHTRPATGTVRRLSVAVVVRNPAPTAAADGAAETAADDAASAPAAAAGLD